MVPVTLDVHTPTRPLDLQVFILVPDTSATPAPAPHNQFPPYSARPHPPGHHPHCRWSLCRRWRRWRLKETQRRAANRLSSAPLPQAATRSVGPSGARQWVPGLWHHRRGDEQATRRCHNLPFPKRSRIRHLGHLRLAAMLVDIRGSRRNRGAQTRGKRTMSVCHTRLYAANRRKILQGYRVRQHRGHRKRQRGHSGRQGTRPPPYSQDRDIAIPC